MNSSLSQTSQRTIRQAMAQAEKKCRVLKKRLTPHRAEVLKLLLAKREAVAAYTIMETMRQSSDHVDRKITPPLVYRALNFLVKIGLVHRIDSINRFIACNHLDTSTCARFLICDACLHIEEVACRSALSKDLLRHAQNRHFKVADYMLEVHGLCAKCTTGKPQSKADHAL